MIQYSDHLFLKISDCDVYFFFQTTVYVDLPIQ